MGQFFRHSVLRVLLQQNLTVFCGPDLPPAFHFVCDPGGAGDAKEMEGEWKVSLSLVVRAAVFVGGPLLGATEKS